MKERRNGTSKYRENGSRVFGPFTLEVREKILRELHKLEDSTGMKLISLDEEEIIQDIWRVDGYHVEERAALLARARGIVAEAA